MTTESLRQIRNVAPFVPFTIQMAGGTKYHVPHRDYLAIHPLGRIATVYLPNRASSTIDIMLITELLEDSVASTTNDNSN